LSIDESVRIAIIGSTAVTHVQAGPHMQRRVAILTAAGLLSIPGIGMAQSAQKKVRIGILFGDAPLRHEEQALLEALREQGLAEGRNLVIERRYAEGRVQLVPGYARELAAMNLDAVISTCTPTTRAAQQALGSTPSSTPIVMAAVADPVGQKIIASLARPGANVTGLSSQAEDILPKMLALFASVLPRPATVAVLVDANSGVHPRMWQALGPAAQQLNIELVRVEAGRKPSDVQLPAAFETAVRQQAAGIVVLPDEPFFLASRAEIVALASKHRLPAFYGIREFVDDGGLMSYGESMRAAYRGVASYIGKLTAGAHPSDMPVSQPTQFELVLNMKTAKDLGLKFPQTLLVSANELIR
jgi:putative ABC transport system substrate-binding protein